MTRRHVVKKQDNFRHGYKNIENINHLVKHTFYVE